MGQNYALDSASIDEEKCHSVKSVGIGAQRSKLKHALQHRIFWIKIMQQTQNSS
jgi:hypothetical protein